MQRTGNVLWFLGFAMIALLWTPVREIDFSDLLDHSDPTQSQVTPIPADPQSEVDKVIAFCMDDRHADSILCTVKNPETEEDLLPITTEIQNRYVRARSSGSNDETTKETRVVERNSTRVEQPVAKQPDPEPEPQNPVNMPELPEIEVPEEVEIPEVDLPVVGNTGNLTNEVIAADSDD